MPFVVQHHDLAAPVQIAQDAPREGVRALFALVHHAVGFAALRLLRFGREPVPVGHQDLAILQEAAQLRRDDVELGVVVLGMLRAQNLQPFADGQVGADDERRRREARIRRLPPAVAKRPRRQHRHHHRLAAPRRHLAAEPGQRIVREKRHVAVRESRREPRPLAAHADLRQVDYRLRRLYLAEEQSARLVRAPPVLQQRLRHVRGVAIARFAPAPDVLAQRVHERQILEVFLREKPPLRLALRALVPKPVARRTTPRRAGRLPRVRVVSPILRRLDVWAGEDGLVHRLHRNPRVLAAAGIRPRPAPPTAPSHIPRPPSNRTSASLRCRAGLSPLSPRADSRPPGTAATSPR